MTTASLLLWAVRQCDSHKYNICKHGFLTLSWQNLLKFSAGWRDPFESSNKVCINKDFEDSPQNFCESFHSMLSDMRGSLPLHTSVWPV